MDNIVLIVITALISGLLATIITIWWQKKSSAYQEKLEIFKILMAHRMRIFSEESVVALNSIDVVFYKHAKVRKAFSDFLDEASKKPEFNPNISDKHLKLLEEISKSLGLKNIHWDDIKQAYNPKGYADKYDEEDLLRKAQLQNAIETANRNADPQNTPIDEQNLAMQLLPELIKHPESIKALLELKDKFEN
jgi:hypothetical protein